MTKWAVVILLNFPMQARFPYIGSWRLEVCILSQAVYCAEGGFGNRFMETTRTSWTHREAPVTPPRVGWNISKKEKKKQQAAESSF